MPTRRTFIAGSVMGVTASAAAMLHRIDGSAALLEDPPADKPAPGIPHLYPTTEPELIREVVGASHANFDKVKELVTARPELAKAAWDWGFGDWETALGACSHTARKDIAELLMAHGARPDIFTFAMLDQVDAVRAICEANPGIQRSLGPHGPFTLMRHATQGKADSVVEYLTELGDADTPQTDIGMSADESGPFLGEYEPAGAPGVKFVVTFHDRFRQLRFKRDEGVNRSLYRLDQTTFSPGGAPSVRIAFEMGEDAAKTLTIIDGAVKLKASKT